MPANLPTPRVTAGVAIVTTLLTLLSAGAVSAHVEPTTPTGEAGRRAEVGFVPTHGCGDAPTIGIDLQLPDGVVDPLPAELDGWTSTVEGAVVSWDGGPLPDGDDATFSVDVLLPATPGVTLYFPTIQRCPDDEQLAWIQQPDDGTDQSFPAPALTVVEATGPPGTTTRPATNAPATTADQGDAPPSTPAPTTTTVPTTTTAPQPVLLEDESDSGGSSLLPVLVTLAGVIVVGAAALVVFHRRNQD